MEALKKKIREVPDFPKPGILFYDLTTLFQDAKGFRAVIDLLTERKALLQRPVVVKGDRAIIGRPKERIRDFLG